MLFSIHIDLCSVFWPLTKGRCVWASCTRQTEWAVSRTLGVVSDCLRTHVHRPVSACRHTDCMSAGLHLMPPPDSQPGLLRYGNLKKYFKDLKFVLISHRPLFYKANKPKHPSSQFYSHVLGIRVITDYSITLQEALYHMLNDSRGNSGLIFFVVQ